METVNQDEKVFFLPGDVVTLKQDIPNKPIMLVLKKDNYIFKNKDTKEASLRGIKCRWFTTEGKLQEATWNTKDLILIK